MASMHLKTKVFKVLIPKAFPNSSTEIHVSPSIRNQRIDLKTHKTAAIFHKTKQ